MQNLNISLMKMRCLMYNILFSCILLKKKSPLQNTLVAKHLKRKSLKSSFFDEFFNSKNCYLNQQTNDLIEILN